ncbi:MaoC family dehydratase [Marinibactrum halimedae]|uniref:MaoC-like domain-containing protein n=1 Tax=Marinibactrum halimedae TaxID=1444977 RepID=A0AA37WKH9_9GAMM|nr:MaoC family dehydratase [Marinibactrum halimedae]MCD9461114.1 MaoC family dehydratase [Marinibactrum halimedae]GLS24454.1 hypothetical protein GCM10007877_01650 [Marinibactrum halimedae]
MKKVSRDVLFDHIGRSLESSEWFTVTQSQIDQFAECTLDHQFIHTDPDKAKETPFGSTIAHGFLSLSMLSHFAESFNLMLEETTMGVNYGFEKVRFIAPVKVNSRIRAHARLKNVVEKNPGQFLMTTEVEIEIEGCDKPALKAEWLGMQVTNV